jgi:peptidoglycan/LPS O-acetylase OafA/YrhL
VCEDNLKRLGGADGIRAIACLMVVVAHMGVRLCKDVQPDSIKNISLLFGTFASGVCVFFVLSGFLLSYPFWEAYLNNKPFPDFKIFTLRRAARIFPGFYVSLIVCFFLGFYFRPGAENVVPRLISGLTFTSALSWKTLFPVEFNGPLWSVGFEVLCYFLMPLFMYGLFVFKHNHTLKSGLLWWVGVLAFTLFINHLMLVYGQTDSYRKGWDYGMVGAGKIWWPHYNPVGFFAQYTIGVISAGLAIHVSKVSKFFIRFDLLAIITTLLLAVLLWYMRNKSCYGLSFQEQPFYYPLFPIGIGLLLISLPNSTFMKDFFDNVFFKLTAKLSFGLYIWHYVMLDTIRVVLNPAYKSGLMNDFSIWILLSVLGFILSYLIAAASWKWIEKPSLDIARKKELQLKNSINPGKTNPIDINGKEPEAVSA